MNWYKRANMVNIVAFVAQWIQSAYETGEKVAGWEEISEYLIAQKILNPNLSETA